MAPQLHLHIIGILNCHLPEDAVLYVDVPSHQYQFRLIYPLLDMIQLLFKVQEHSSVGTHCPNI